MVDVGESASDGIGGIPKRTLLIGALVIGGGVGLFMFISRKASAPSATAENKAQTDVPQNTLTLAYQNLAEQLLGFRGDVSVANANLAQNEQDILSQLGNESSSRASNNRQLMASIWQVFYRQTFPNATWEELVTKNPYLAGTADPSSNSGESGTTLNGASSSPVNGQQTGAGGATPRDAIMAAFGANEDDSHYYLAHMSSGPVRQISSRSY